MEKNIQKKPYTFVAAEDPKPNPIATVRINQTGLKVKNQFGTAYKCQDATAMFPAFDTYP